jgi:D-glycero-D-manno-heptose 1,7-bisphosphate phosphatase
MLRKCELSIFTSALYRIIIWPGVIMKAVFLDRDGVINKTIFRMGKERAPYSLEEFEFIDGVVETVQKLKEEGFLVIVVTNQPDVARGWVSMEQVTLVNNLIKEQLPIDDIKVCFHTDKDQCFCRKPMPGMLLEAGQKWNINFQKSFMIGDRESDVEAGQRAGCKSILVGSHPQNLGVNPDHQCSDLREAHNWIKTH